MKIMEVDLQHMVLLKLNGTLDASSVQEVAQRTQALLKKNRFKIIIDLKRVLMDNNGLIYLAAFLREFKENDGSIKLIVANGRGSLKIELQKIPGLTLLSAGKTIYH